MRSKLCEVITRLLAREQVPLERREVDVSFEAPNREWEMEIRSRMFVGGNVNGLQLFHTSVLGMPV
jgi:hypothetical protein